VVFPHIHLPDAMAVNIVHQLLDNIVQ
jgi:hypothetical protein